MAATEAWKIIKQTLLLWWVDFSFFFFYFHLLLLISHSPMQQIIIKSLKHDLRNNATSIIIFSFIQRFLYAAYKSLNYFNLFKFNFNVTSYFLIIPKGVLSLPTIIIWKFALRWRTRALMWIFCPMINEAGN